MMILQILENINIKNFFGKADLEISDIVYDSRKVIKNCLFVCLKGQSFDGHTFAKTAAENGATAIISESPLNLKNVTNIVVENSRKVLAQISCNFFGNPSKKLTTIGITGTKGKTTTAFMIKTILECADKKVGLIGTLGVIQNNKTVKLENTTPESYEVQKYLADMVKNGCKYVVIETTSIGLKNCRLDGIKFEFGIFTNFSEDHIGKNEHNDLNEYLKSKNILFNRCKIGILNRDDTVFDEILKPHVCQVETFGLSKNATIYAQNIKAINSANFIGSSFTVCGKLNLEVKIPIIGKFNVYNALSAISVCNLIGVSKQIICDGMGKTSVKGRTEFIKNPFDFSIIIDFAHNAISMENILVDLKKYNPNRIIMMFGAGGNRAKSRRFQMGEISGKYADLSVITADNSRFENLKDILNDIEKGVKKTFGKYVIIEDRREAMEFCIKIAKKGDIVVFAGKGHEDYQEVNGVKHNFSEHKIIQEIIESGIPFMRGAVII